MYRVLIMSLIIIFSHIVFLQAQSNLIIVNSTGNEADSAIGDGYCNTGNGECTLKAAIQEANFRTGKDTIIFNIPGPGPHTIQPNPALPMITDTLIIDGTSEPDYVDHPVIEIDGSNAGGSPSTNNAHGLNFVGVDKNVIRGLCVNNFLYGAGLNLEESDQSLVQKNYFGTNVSGTEARPNWAGLHYSSDDCLIGGTDDNDANLISGNIEYGLVSSFSRRSIIQGNLIGTDVTGNAAIPNGTGFYFHGSEGTLGGPEPGAGNVISGNNIEIALRGNWMVVQGNFFGLNIDGTQSLANGEKGLYIFSDFNLIGGSGIGEGNIISGNYSTSIDLFQSNDNKVQGNYIGTDATGSNLIARCDVGIHIHQYGEDHIISNNIISGCDSAAILIRNDPGETSIKPEDNLIAGNIIGADQSATNILGNGTGIIIEDNPHSHIIGGSKPGYGNLIAGSIKSAIKLNNAHATIRGNYIGTDYSGLLPMPNGANGIELVDCNNIIMGGEDSSAANVIACNILNGISIHNGINHSILSNNIFENGHLGIDLGNNGLTVNDSLDSDDGPNHLQNSAELKLARVSENSLTIDFSVNSNPSYSAYPLQVQFFLADSNGQGKRYIKSAMYTVDDYNGAGLTQFVVENFVNLINNVAEMITATITDNDGNTSEFSSVIVIDVETDIETSNSTYPNTLGLHQNYPNPFNSATSIRYNLARAAHVIIEVYNILGQRVATLENTRKQPGNHKLKWNATGLNSGIYYYRLIIKNSQKSILYSDVKKMILLQ